MSAWLLLLRSRSICSDRRRRCELVSTFTDKSSGRARAFALRACFGPRFSSRGFLHVSAGGFSSRARVRIGARYGTLGMHARRRIRRLTAYRAKRPVGSHSHGNGLSFTHRVSFLNLVPARLGLARHRTSATPIARFAGVVSEVPGRQRSVALYRRRGDTRCVHVF